MTQNPKQGDGLDPKFGIRGWWVVYPTVFLFVPPPEGIHTELPVPGSAGSAIGFNIVEMASAFGGDASALALNNQIGALTVYVRAGELMSGIEQAVDYVFGLPTGQEIVAPVKTAVIKGSA